MSQKIIYIASPNSQQIHVWSINQKRLSKLIQILDTHGQVQPIVIHPNKSILYAGIRPTPQIIKYYIKKDGTLNKMKEFLIPAYSTHLNINIMGTILYSVSYKNNCLNVIELDHEGSCISILQTLTGLMGCHSSYIEIPHQRLWIPCLKEDCIRLYNIDHVGNLNINSLQKIYTASYSGPRHMVFHHSYNYAYLINELNSTVNVIKIDTLTNYQPEIIETTNIIPNNSNYKNIHNWASDIHITPDDRWLYCSERNMNIISCFKISNNTKKNKQLKFVNYQPTEIQPRGFAIDNQGKFLVVAGQKSNCFSIYNIDQKTGGLIQLFRAPVGDGPMWISILNQDNN